METTKKVTSRLTNKIRSIEKEVQGFEEKQTLLYNSRGLYEKPYFIWHLWFAHIFKNGGFDIVIANPPYKRDTAYDDVKDKMQLGNMMDPDPPTEFATQELSPRWFFCWRVATRMRKSKRFEPSAICSRTTTPTKQPSASAVARLYAS